MAASEPRSCPQRRLAVITLSGVAMVLAGCSSGSPTAASTELAKAVALGNATCRELNRAYPSNERPAPDSRAAEARLRTLEAASQARIRVMMSVAGSLPSVRRLRADITARRKLEAALQRMSKGVAATTPRIDGRSGHILSITIGRRGESLFSLFKESYPLNLKVYDDAKALGLTACVGQPPRKPIEG